MPVNNRWLKFAFWTAGANWLKWREDFEFKGDMAKLPVLVEEERHLVFTNSYGLLRYWKSKKRNELRSYLRKSKTFKLALTKKDGRGVEELREDIKKKYPKRPIGRSYISKLMAFADPASFIAWDRFARKGVVNLTGGPKNGGYASYADYLAAVNTILHGEIGDAIRNVIKKNRVPTQNHRAFELRVLDVYLMVCGGRWSTELGRKV